jgi:MoxR-like ATPase
MTDNALGADMESSRYDYSGVNADMNAALLDRVGAMAHVGYLEPAQEHSAIASAVPSIATLDLEGMVRTANEVRKSNEVTGGFSTRMLQNWARRVAAGRLSGNGTITSWSEYTGGEAYIMECAKGAFLRRMSSEVERDSVMEIIRRVFVFGQGEG